MAGAPAGLPSGVRLSDHISLGVIARTFPLEEVRQVLAETGKASERERDLPAHVMVVPVHSLETPICAYAAMGSWPIWSART